MNIYTIFMPTVICEIICSIIMLPCFPCIYDQSCKKKNENQVPNRIGFGTLNGKKLYETEQLRYRYT